jgi:hypothetical protein
MKVWAQVRARAAIPAHDLFVRIYLIVSACSNHILITAGGLRRAGVFYIAVHFVNGKWFRE